MAPVTIWGVDGWTRTISDAFVELTVERATESFRGALDRRDLGREITLTRVATDPSRVLRTARLARDGCDDVLFLMHVSGRGGVTRQGRRTPMPVGFGSLHSADEPYELDFAELSNEVVLQLPRRLLPSRDQALLHGDPIGITPQEPAMRVLWSFAQELHAVSDRMPQSVRADMGETAIGLLLSVLKNRTLHETLRLVGPEATYQSLRSTISANACDPDFTVECAAAHHRISLRYAQILFRPSGTSPASFLRSERLAHAQRLLADPRQRDLPIEAIAYRSGFSDVNTFIRAFKRAFTTTPGAWRAEVQRTDIY